MKIMVAGVILGVAPVYGAVYMWRDAAGVAHYTNKEYDVPARYKAKAKVLYPDVSDSGASQPGTANIPAAPVVQPPAAASQGAVPAAQPVTRSVAPDTQIENTPPKTPDQRNRRRRERSAEGE